MPITKQQKVMIIKDLTDKLSRSKSVFFSKFFGTSANDINDLRRQFRQAGSEYIVAKKTLLDRIFSESEINGVKAKEMSGEVAAIFSYDDEVAPAKVLNDFSKKHESMEIIGGVLEKKYIDAAQVKALAQLPSKHQLYGMVVGTINAPISGFVNALAGNLKNVLYVLKAVGEKKS
ncbi:MAG: 50S ribosomal protein L10 [bacterium]|nr:50S ribosomal protein L10 [bacterium]